MGQTWQEQYYELIHKEVEEEIFYPLKGKHNKGRVVGSNGTTGKIITDDELKRKQEYAIRESNRKEGKFYNVVVDKVSYLVEDVGLTDSELAYLWYIGRKVEFHNQYPDKYFIKLVKSNKDKSGLSNKDLRKMLNLDTKSKNAQWQRFKDKCINYGVLMEEEKEFYLNKAFIFKGSVDGQNVVSTRITNTNDFLTNFKPKDIGVLINLQRFINKETLCLVENPNETDVNKLVYIESQRHLEAVSGINRTAFKRLWNMKVDNRCILTFFKNADRQGYIVNPQVFYRGEFTIAEEVYKITMNVF